MNAESVVLVEVRVWGGKKSDGKEGRGGEGYQEKLGPQPLAAQLPMAEPYQNDTDYRSPQGLLSGM